MHRLSRMAAYMGPQWIAYFNLEETLKGKIRDSIDDDAVFARTREQFTAPDLSGFTITATRAP